VKFLTDISHDHTDFGLKIPFFGFWGSIFDFVGFLAGNQVECHPDPPFHILLF
jgi:hypothetical protein